MPTIDINANVNVTGGTSPPSGGRTASPGAPPAPAAPGAASPAGVSARAASDLAAATAREAAARRALTQRLGRTLTDAQVSQVSRDFAEMSRGSQRLRRFGGDMEKWMSGFSATFPSNRQANRHYSDVMGQLGLGSPQNRQAGGTGPMIQQAMRGLFQAAMPGGGGVAGSIMSHGVNQAGEAGGMGSAGGMAMMGKAGLIGALAYAGIKAVQKVSEKVGQAQDESVQYHDLREAVGGAAVDFDNLRAVTRKYSDGLGISSDESAKLAKRYAQTSQIYGGGSAEGIASGVGQGAQLSRGFGLSPEAGVDFMATMRHFGQSGSEKDNRKLAFQIGDAVGKTGAFSKADDVMSAIASFVESTSRQSLQVANVDGFASMLGGLGGLKLPGMDASGAASMMQRLAGSWSSGGGAGEASSAMRLGWAQRFGATAFDMPAIDGAGPMASARSTFGPGSPAYLGASPSERRRLQGLADSGGDKSFLSQEMSSIQGQYGERALPLALMKQYGLNHAQASILSRANADGGMSGLQGSVTDALKGTGVNPDSISAAQMSKLAMISYGGDKDLKAMSNQARELGGKQTLTADERKMLDGAADEASLKKALTRIFAVRETEDEGKTARQAQVDLDRKFQEFAQKMIPLTNMIQEGVFKLVSIIPGGMTPEMEAFQRQKRLDAEMDALPSGDASGRQSAIDTEAGRVTHAPATNRDFLRNQNDILQKMQKEGRPQSEIDAALGKAKSEYEINRVGSTDAYRREILGKSSDPFDRMLGVESGGRQFGRDGKTLLGPQTKYGRAVGISQMLESTGPEAARDAGLAWDKNKFYNDSDYNQSLGRGYHGKLLKKYSGDERKAAAAYNWGPGNLDRAIGAGGNWEGALPQETTNYLKNTRAGDKRIPDTAKRPGSGGQLSGKMGGSVNVSLMHPNGAQQDIDVPISGRFGQSYAGSYA